MLKQSSAKILTLSALALFIIGSLFIVFNKSKKVITTISSVSSNLNTFCSCYLLTDSKIIDTTTGQSRQRIPASSKQFPKAPQYLSPSKTQEILITVDQKEAYLLRYPSLTITHLFTAPETNRLGHVVWLQDEKDVALEIVDPNVKTTDGTEGAVTSVIAVDVGTLVSRPILDVTASVPNAKEGFSLFWVSNDFKHNLFVAGNMVNFRWFRTDFGEVTQISEDISGAIYLSIAVLSDASGKIESRLLWVDDQGLRGYTIETGETENYTISTWSDEPVSPPSPDGTSVIYLKRASNNQAGQLARLDLRDKSELVLSNELWTDPSGLGQALWSPEGTKLLVPHLVPESGWVAVNAQTRANLRSVSHPEIDNYDNEVRAAIKPF